MNTLQVADLKPGHIFSAPVYLEGDNLLVPADVPLRQKDIDFLTMCDIDVVTTTGNIINVTDDHPEGTASPSTGGAVNIPKFNFFDNDFLDKFIHDEEVVDAAVEESISSGNHVRLAKFSIEDVLKNASPYRAYRGLIERIASVFSAIKSGLDVEIRTIDNVGLQLLKELKEYHDSFITYILGGEIIGNELAKSSVNIAILSALIAQEMKMPNHRIVNLVSAALLHDIGMIRLPKGITEKRGGLSDAEYELLKSHTLHTSRIITKEMFGTREISLIALYHHERWDGMGYPDRLAGEAINIGSRIISVADAFEAMVSKKSYRESMSGYEAIKNLLADNGRRFDPEVIMIFTKIMGIYPIGSIVMLNDKSIARVEKLNIEAPLRPVVQMLADKDGNVLETEERIVVDLLSEKKLYIKCAVDS